MQTLIVGLLLAGVSATTLVAFKHPLGYARLFPYLIGAVTMVFVCVVVWHVAVEMTWRGLEQYIGPDSSANANSTKEALSLTYYWAAFWFVALLAFLWVNLKLPRFLQITDHD